MCASQKVVDLHRVGLKGKEKEVSYPFQAISMDLLGPLLKSKSGTQYRMIDQFSKFVLVYPLKGAITASIINFLKEQVFLIYGVPEIVMLIMIPNLRSKIFTNF